MNNRIFFIIILSIIVLAGCVSPYYPAVTNYEKVLVVDGQLTNLTGPYLVKLSRSYKYSGGTGELITGAKVKFIDDKGLEVELKEISMGSYSTVDTTFRGIVGNSYKLQVKINNDVFETDFQQLKNPIPIDKIYWEYKPKDNLGDKGIRLLLDTHDPSNNTRYYAWEYEETWKFRVAIDVMLHQDWRECYRSINSTSFRIGSTVQLKTDAITHNQLLFIDEKTNRLFLRYSLLVKQFALSEHAYNFFDGLVNLNQNQGSLFDPIPYSLTGNLKCITNKNIPVLGYFLVTGVSEKRIFIDKSELPTEYRPTDGNENCNDAIIDLATPWSDKYNENFYPRDRRVDSCLASGLAVYNVVRLEAGTRLFMARPVCFKCIVIGDNKVPGFWTEK